MKKNYDARLRGAERPKDERTRAWTLIVYEDSAPEDWRFYLATLGYPVYISPLHDKDVRADGTPKKPHYHVVLYSKNRLSAKQVQDISDNLSGVHVDWEHCAVGDMRKMIRYLVHFDDADKAQYDMTGIETISGADYLQYFEQSADIDSAVGEMMEWVDVSEYASLAELARYAKRERPDWLRVLTAKRTQFMRAYCQAVAWERRIGHDMRPEQEEAEAKPTQRFTVDMTQRIAFGPLPYRDVAGRRMYVCTECGCVGVEDDFIPGGASDYPNQGICKDCYK